MLVALKGAHVWRFSFPASVKPLIDSGTDSAAALTNTQHRATFGRAVRLLKPAEFERVFAENERARTDTLLVMVRPNAFGRARLGMIIAKRLLPRAVDRNRIKRCVRETFRVQRMDLPACDFVIRLIAKPEAGKETRDLTRTLTRAGQRATRKWPVLPLIE